MNTLPQAFKTRRVKETLVALSQHVETALNLARLEPVQTSEPELSGDILQPLPEVSLIEPSPISYEDRITTTSIKVTGDYLDAVSEVYLIRIGEVGPWVVSGSGIAFIYDSTGKVITDLTATVDLTKAPHGHYNLLLIDEYGQTALVRNASTIAPPTSKKSPSPRHR